MIKFYVHTFPNRGVWRFAISEVFMDPFVAAGNWKIKLGDLSEYHFR